MPPIGFISGNIEFSNLNISLKRNTTGGDVAIKYGLFIQDLVNFFIIALSVFILIRFIMKIYKKKDEEIWKTGPPAQEVLLTEIRDILKSKAAI